MRQTKSKFNRPNRRPRWIRRSILVLLIIAAVLVVGGFVTHYEYNQNLEPANPNGVARQLEINPGSSVDDIAKLLKNDGIIKSEWAFKFYVTRSDAGNKLKYGVYNLSPSMNVGEIVSILTDGKVASSLVTILPGQRLDQIKASLIKDGFSEASVTTALDPASYPDNPALTDRPKGASLEGFLYPDSFARVSSTSPQIIIGESLDEMASHLTPGLRADFAKNGLNTYQAITLASIIEKEVPNPDDRAKVAQVFYKRLAEGMALQSDPTAVYGAVLAGQSHLSTAQAIAYNSPYNTYLHTGLPPSPISNVSAGSLEAVAHPATTDYLFFVSGDDGVTHFSKTLAEHQANVANYCHEKCGD